MERWSVNRQGEGGDTAVEEKAKLASMSTLSPSDSPAKLCSFTRKPKSQDVTVAI